MRFSKKDFIVIPILLLACIALLFVAKIFSSQADTVQIYYDNSLYKELSLYVDATVNVNGTNTVVIKNRKVYMESATCHDQLCVKQGTISNSSKDIVCLPNKVVVKTTKKSKLDSVSR